MNSIKIVHPKLTKEVTSLKQSKIQLILWVHLIFLHRRKSTPFIE